VGGKEANDPWANFLPGRATVPPERTRPEASRNGHDGYGHDRRERTQNQSTASARRPSHASEATTRIRLGKDLAQSWTTREILHAAELHLEEFDVVHSVVALHRIAKSTDRGELRHDQRLTAVLAKLADTAASATAVSSSSNEMPHVKEVSKALWALAKVGPWADNFEGYGPRGIESGSWSGRAWTGVHRSLKALGTSAIGRLHELDSHGLSNVAWSLAVARFDQRGFVTAISRTALQLLPDFQAQGLANTAWAMAHLLAEPEGRGPERKLLECIAKEVGRNAHDFTPQGLANIGWAFATLALRHEHLMDAVSRELAEGAGNWSQQNLANILWAFAKVAVQPRAGAVRAVVGDALLTIQSWSALNITNLTWSFAKLAVRHQELFSAVESECQQKLLHFSSQNLVNVAWAFAKVVLARQNFFEQIARRAVELAPDFNPQNCSNAVWAFAAVGLASPNLLAATARRAEELAPELQAQDLANLAWAFAKLGRRDAALEETVASEVLQKVESFSPQHLSIIVYSFAQLLAAGTGLQATPSTAATAWPRPEDVRRSNPAPAPSAASMVEAILTAATKRVREFDAQGLTNLAQSLAKLEIQREGLHNALVEEAAAKVSSFTNQELAMFAWAAARLGRFAGRALRMVSKETKARLQDLTAQDLSVLVWSFARSGGEDTQDSERSRVPAGAGMLNTLTSTVMRLLRELTPQDLSTIIWGYATAGVEAASMIEAVANESVKKVAKFAPQDMANVAWGLAKLGLLHEQLLEVLCRDFVARANECQAQHLSIAAWSFAKLGVASDELFEAIARSLAGRAGELDPQGVGNSLWAFGVLCFWHRPCVKAVGGRAVRSVSELTVQEMANVAFGLHTLLRWRRPAADDEAEDDAAMLLKLVMDFLAASGSLFCRKAGLGDGASWTDFANVAKAVSQEGAQAQSDVLKELEVRFRRLHLEKLLEELLHTQQGGEGALSRVQQVLDDASIDTSVFGGVPHLGEQYSKEALQRLGLMAKEPTPRTNQQPEAAAAARWVDDARRQCRAALGGNWQIPATDTVVAHVSWDVTCFDHTWRNSGKVYHAASQRAQARGAAPAAVPKTIEDLLAPLRQHLRRDTHPERLALLELMHAMAQAEADETLEELSDQSLRDFLKKCEGAVQVYVSQYPCVSCLAVFCQFKHRCPKIGLEVAFDNAWTSFCGRPRCQVR
ncbi:RAP, partial [Symbiodinium sp. CCMP2456]